MTLPDQTSAHGYYKKALMALCVCLALFASYDTCGKSAGSKLDEIHENKGSLGSNSFKITSLREKFEYFDEFIVYLKNDRKPAYSKKQGAGREDRILVCSVVIQLNRGVKLSKERLVLRKIIYKILKELPGLLERGNWPKGEIKSGLNEFMGGEIVKNVYFTKFVLL